MFYYRFENKTLISQNRYDDFEEISENQARKCKENLYYLLNLKGRTRRSFCLAVPSLAFVNKEDINLLCIDKENYDKLPNWLEEKIDNKEIKAINTEYPKWEKSLSYIKPKRFKVNVFGLGDVGGTLVTGLRLLGGDSISQVGIYDRSDDKVKRWEYEANQILSPDKEITHPQIKGISKDELFDCDMFVFCASIGVPTVGSEVKDVRMIQFEGNSKIIGEYAKMAREENFKGIFAVVSDPVDLLCKSVFIQSNTDKLGNMDHEGLAPEQIRGYGLGVMNARATYYASKNTEMESYLNEGRAYGPHGKGLIIANSIENYDDEISNRLTEMTIKANMRVRETGFKPYIAPALSSGSLSILATIRGDWHYSATYLGGVYMGARNRLNNTGIELERKDLPEKLINKLKHTYRELDSII